MATTTTSTDNFQIIQKTAEDAYLIMHPETDAAIVKATLDGISEDEISTVQEALEYLQKSITAATESAGVSGVKGDNETEYRTGLVSISKENIGLGNVDNVSSTEIEEAAVATANEYTDKTVASAKTEIEDDISTELGNYYTKTEIDAGYYTQSDIDSKITELQEDISAIPKFAVEVVDALPTSDISKTTVYLMTTGSETNNLYTEYIYVNSNWEKLGEQKLDLTDYVTSSDLTDVLGDYYTKSETYTQSEVNALIEGVTVTVDTTLSADSGNPVASSAIYTAINDIKSSEVTGVTSDGSATVTVTTSAGTTSFTIDNVANATKASTADSATTAGTADSATYATSAGTADSATKADALSNTVTVTLSGGVTGTASTDGSADVTITTELADSPIAEALTASGVSEGVYSAVSVNAKGIVTAGAQVVEVGDDDEPQNLAVGGIYFKKI